MSTLGSFFRISTFGESHCKAVGVIIDGCPPGLPLNDEDIQPQLNRRRPGQNKLTTPRDEKDKVSIISGTEMGFTLGTPIAIMVPNQDQRPHDYGSMDMYPRPSHADWTYLQKYGIKASSGGGRSSARETVGRVAAAAVAEKYLQLAYGIQVVAFVSSVGPISMEPIEPFRSLETKDQWMSKWNSWWAMLKTITREDVDTNDVRCPSKEHAMEMQNVILQYKDAQDSIGGSVVCVIRNVPVGLGEPCFDKLEAQLAHAMLSIPATKGFEIGSGIQGGISNGEDIYFKVGFKPAATIGFAQKTAAYHGEEGVLAAKGRHDPCVLPRAVPIVEAMATLVIMDMLLAQLSRKSASSALSTTAAPDILRGIVDTDMKKHLDENQ
ncbi:hypothetical protein BASA60_009112 [Batrachochytrium salamandrivorans]|nr:hypothetical protein BASA60_009112 [Batrachochytrium salamandrivorans]